MKKDPLLFRIDLLAWYDRHGRDLPWRITGTKTQNPYNVWLSEVMLQQTTVQAVVPYYLKFMDRWPTVEKLAKAQQSEVTDMWAGLGYYSRARNLHKCAQVIANDYNGQFPEDEKALLSLPGIGSYTANAIQAIAYNKPANVVDGNVERIMARLFAIKTPFPDGKVKAKKMAGKFINKHEGLHSDYAQALMDLGAIICRPKSPLCYSCPVSKNCDAFQQGITNDLPKRKKKVPLPHKVGNVSVIISKDHKILLERRVEKGMLSGMIGLPTSEWLEAKDPTPEPLMGQLKGDIKTLFFVKHIFTHFSLSLTPTIIQLDIVSAKFQIKDDRDLYWKDIRQLDVLELPTLFRKVLRMVEY